MFKDWKVISMVVLLAAGVFVITLAGCEASLKLLETAEEVNNDIYDFTQKPDVNMPNLTTAEIIAIVASADPQTQERVKTAIEKGETTWENLQDNPKLWGSLGLAILTALYQKRQRTLESKKV